MPSVKRDKRGKQTKEEETYVNIPIDNRLFKATIIKEKRNGKTIERYQYRPTKTEKHDFPGLRDVKQIKKTRYAELQDAIREKINQGKNYSSYSLKSGIIRYYETRQAHTTTAMRPQSYANCIYTVNNYIIPYFGSKSPKEITSQDCDKMLSALLDAGYSKSVIDKAYIYLNRFLEHLLDSGELTINPLRLATRPKQEKIQKARKQKGKVDKERKYLSDEQVNKILDVIYNGYDNTWTNKKGKTITQHRTFSQPAAFEVWLYLGLRGGEMVALKYSDWDEENQTITVNTTRVTYWDYSGEKPVLVTREDDPKTEASKAPMMINSYTQALLKDLKAHEPEGYTGYIMHDKDHQPIQRRALEDRWNRALIAAGITKEAEAAKKEGKEFKWDGKTKLHPLTSAHGARHSVASKIWEETHDIEQVRDYLRHKDTNTTQNVYIHMRDERKRKKIEEFHY